MTVTVISELNDFKDIINGDKAVVIDFWARWCGPCRTISPVFEKLSNEVPDVLFYQVDIDEVPVVAEEVGIRVVPTFMYFKGGNKVNEATGADIGAVTALVKEAQVAQTSSGQ